MELGPETAPASDNSMTADSTVSSIREERSITYQSHPANLNQSNISNQSMLMNRSNHANHANHANQVRVNQVPNHQPEQYQRNFPQQRQARPASMDMKFVSAGYHYVEHGPRPLASAPGTRYQHYPSVDPLRTKMAAGHYVNHHQQQQHPYSWQMAQGASKNGPMPGKAANEYLQQYMPPYVFSCCIH